jgi:hypothetical protein
MAHGSCDTVAHGFPRAVDRFPSGMDSNKEENYAQEQHQQSWLRHAVLRLGRPASVNAA